MPPFRSEAQRRWMHKNHPEMAAQWEKDTPKDAKLPEHVADETKFLDRMSRRKR